MNQKTEVIDIPQNILTEMGRLHELIKSNDKETSRWSKDMLTKFYACYVGYVHIKNEKDPWDK